MDQNTARDDLRAAGQKYQAARASLDTARENLHPAVIEALRAGLRQVEIVRLSGYTREYVRKIARRLGIESDR
jgi:cation transport ATPase